MNTFPDHNFPFSLKTIVAVLRLLGVGVGLLFLLFSCGSPSPQTQETEGEQQQDVRVDSPEVVEMESHASFPVQIQNDKGRVDILGLKTLVDGELAESYFSIQLTEIEAHNLAVRVDKSTLIDKNPTVSFLDSVTQDFTSSAVIRDIRFEFVRSSTLYFSVELLNPRQRKVIYGRFALFYIGKKKGQVYGWFTDEIQSF